MIPSKWGEISTNIDHMQYQYETGGFMDIVSLVVILSEMNLLLDDIREQVNKGGD
jgi:hypothetical protein